MPTRGTDLPRPPPPTPSRSGTGLRFGQVSGSPQAPFSIARCVLLTGILAASLQNGLSRQAHGPAFVLEPTGPVTTMITDYRHRACTFHPSLPSRAFGQSCPAGITFPAQPSNIVDARRFRVVSHRLGATIPSIRNTLFRAWIAAGTCKPPFPLLSQAGFLPRDATVPAQPRY